MGCFGAPTFALAAHTCQQPMAVVLGCSAAASCGALATDTLWRFLYALGVGVVRLWFADSGMSCDLR